MPVTYEIDVERKTLRTKCTGMVTMHEVLGHFRSLQQDPECPELLDVFLDLREVQTLPDSLQLSGVVSEVKRIQGRVRFGACAILASRDALFGMMRIFEVLGEQYFRVTRTFRIAAEAEAWLVLQQSVADQSENGTALPRG